MTYPEFHRPIAVDRLGHQEKAFEIEADAAERDALARRFGIIAVEALQATVRLRLVAGGSMVSLKGRFVADVVQTCVVTLEPVPGHLEEEFTLTYGTPEPDESPEVVVDLDAEDPPEPIDNGIIDIGEATAEHLALALDPFPRAAGASFKTIDDGPAEESKPHPFAALAALKKK